MIDINIVRTNPEVVRIALQHRQKDVNLLDSVQKYDTEYRQVLLQVEDLRSQQNKLGKDIKDQPTPDQITQGRQLKEKLRVLEDMLKTSEKQLNTTLAEIPNIPSEDTPLGKDDSDNVVLKTVGTKPEFDFTPLDHVELGKRLDIIDVDKAGVISGSRFGYFKGKAAILEMSVMFYAMQKLVAKGWTAMVPPAMVKSDTEWKMGYASNNNLFNAYYSIPEDDLIFISSSEHVVVPYHMDEVLDAVRLPLRYVNFSPCFRREAGTYGKDTRGLFRVHFFNKVEMNAFTFPDFTISDAMCEEMLAIEEEVMQELGLCYQVVKCCTGDLPQPNRRMYDINTWFPGQNHYRETQSCSNCGDYQARRLNTKVKIDGKNHLVHILNATVITDRAVLAIIENFQTKAGEILIPKVLQTFTGFDKISPTL